MSDGYVVALATAVVLVLASRIVVPSLPLTRWAAPMTATDTVFFGAGSIGLAIHCGAMFFPSWVRPLPGGHEVIRLVDPLGTTSILGFAVAAALVVFGLRHQCVVARVLSGVALAAVGYTMYDSGRLQTHLMVIFATVVLLAAVLALLVVPPWRGRGSRSHTGAPPLPAL